MCRNPQRPSICLCPAKGVELRSALAQKFINGWLGAGLTDAANKLADDPSVSEDRLWRMLFTLEDEASAAYEVWQAYQ